MCSTLEHNLISCCALKCVKGQRALFVPLYRVYNRVILRFVQNRLGLLKHPILHILTSLMTSQPHLEAVPEQGIHSLGQFVWTKNVSLALRFSFKSDQTPMYLGPCNFIQSLGEATLHTTMFLAAGTSIETDSNLILRIDFKETSGTGPWQGFQGTGFEDLTHGYLTVINPALSSSQSYSGPTPAWQQWHIYGWFIKDPQRLVSIQLKNQ
jgi:hypothetical protein